MPLERILTIGVYGYTAEDFFAALEAAGTDLFCDLRARRGLRGREYAFANAVRLQTELAARGIAYRHFRELAPTREIRSPQYATDVASGIAKRKREQLDASFIERYAEVLQGREAQTALAEIRDTAAAPVLFCVERVPSACHRSLVAQRLADEAIPVEHLLP